MERSKLKNKKIAVIMGGRSGEREVSLRSGKRVLESKSVVPGGGAVETALSIHLENFATSLDSREQLAIAEFARALLVIPKTLAVNAAQDAFELVAKLRAFHNTSQTDPTKTNLKWIGLDLVNGTVRDNRKAGVLEPGMSKVKSINGFSALDIYRLLFFGILTYRLYRDLVFSI